MPGDPAPNTPAESTKQMLDSVIAGLPDLLATYSKNVAPTNQTLLEARKLLAPQEQQFNIDLAKQFQPQLADIYTQTALDQANADSRVLDKTSLIDSVLNAQKKVDPEFFANREAAGKGFTSLLSSLDPTRLDDNELASVERGVNRTNAGRGLTGAPSNSAAISNALTFGDRLNDKKDRLTNALNTFSGIQSGSRTGIDPYKVATGKSAASDFGGTKFTGTSGGSNTSDIMGLTSGLLGEAGQNTRQYNDLESQRRDSLDRASQLMSSLPNVYV